MNHLKLTNILGEGVIWDANKQLLWWIDIQAKILYCYEFSLRKLEQWSTPERLCSLGLYRSEPYSLLVAFESGFAIYSPYIGEIEWLYQPELPAGVRFNDGRCDRQGRFWAGTMGEGNKALKKPGALYCLQEKERAVIHLEMIGISNSLCWSPDGRILYFADSLEHRIDMFDVDSHTGLLENRRCFVQLPAHIYPDGSTVDAEGYLWNAQWGASRVVRYAPDGREDRIINLPVTQPSCVALAGPELNILCITTAREGLTQAQLQKEPLAGSLLMIETDCKGLPEELVQFL